MELREHFIFFWKNQYRYGLKQEIISFCEAVLLIDSNCVQAIVPPSVR